MAARQQRDRNILADGQTGGGRDSAAVGPEMLGRLDEAAGVTVWIWNPGTDQLFHAHADPPNGTLAQGVPVSTAIMRMHPGDRARVRRRLRAAARKGDSGRFRFRYDPALGPERHLDATYFPVRGSAGEGEIQIIVHDVTRLARAERRLRESEDHYRNAVALNPEIPWLADAGGNIIEAGPRWLEMVGMTMEETLGHGWINALHPDDLGSTIELWQASLVSGEPVDLEYRVRMRDGQYRWMRARAAARRHPETGVITRWYGTLEDVHDRHVAVSALRDSDEFARSILESAVSAIEVLDFDGRLIFMNGPGLRVMEVDDFEPVRGTPFVDVWPPGERERIAEALVRARHGETTRQTLFAPTAKGNPRWWDISISPIRGADGTVRRLLAASRDVTDVKRSQEELAASAKRLANVLESTMDCVLSVDADWRILYINRRAQATFPNLAPGDDLRDTFLADADPFFARYRNAMRDRSAVAFEDCVPGTQHWFEVHAYGSAGGLIIFFRDVTERHEAQEQLAHLASHDALTGLANRVHFHDQLHYSLSALSPGRSLALFSIDLDDFKVVNDSSGHPVGDALLKEVARRLTSVAGNHTVARLGGDEFALLTPVEGLAQAIGTARALLESVGAGYVIDDEPVTIGASIGVALAPHHAADAEELFRRADIALYRVKSEGGHGFRVFEPEMERALRERRELKRELAHALDRGELSVVYQPQFDMETSQLVGFEALLRWWNPSYGQISPDLFVPLAEEGGFIDALGRFVLDEACAAAVSWPESVSIAVNMSPAQFRSGGNVHQVVTEALERSGLAPHRLELEITETLLLDDSTDSTAALEQFHAAGIRVALDDFGTGYSSLSYLRRFPFDKIKIDRSFVGDLPDAPGSVAIVRAIIGLARALRTRVTAEGVETWDQLMMLKAEGCNEAQGYLFSRPLRVDDARELAATRALTAGDPGRRRA